MKPMTVRQLIKVIEADGWVFDRHGSGHRQYVHPTKPGHVSVPKQLGQTLAIGTQLNILRQAGLR